MAKVYVFWGVIVLLLTFSVPKFAQGRVLPKIADELEQTNMTSSSNNTKLMVILLDGFRWNYYEAQKERLPGFTAFLKNGVQASWVNPVVPSVSFPNWHSLSTGLYPENHGILDNEMLNISKVLENQGKVTAEAVFSLRDLNTTFQPSWWESVEPIWTTANRFGRKTFCWSWSRCDVHLPGSEKISPPDPENTGYFEVGVEHGLEIMAEGLDKGLEKLESGSDLALIYVEYPDEVGHKFGGDSPEMQKAVVEIDGVFSQFLQKLYSKYGELSQKLNIIVTSDHGMTNIGPNSGTQYVALQDLMGSPDVAAFVNSSAFVGLVPAPGRTENLYQNLKKVKGVDVYLSSQIPEEWHYKHNPLVLPLLVVAKPGYAIVSADEPITTEKGQHGWIPQQMEDMRAIFYASGPAFRKNLVCPPIEMVDIYQIYPYILNFPPQPHNGTWNHVQKIFA